MENTPTNACTPFSEFPRPPRLQTPSILAELFIYNKYSRYVPIVKSHTAIERLYEELRHPPNDHELIFLLETLERIITSNPDVLSLLSPVNSNNKFFTTLIEVFLMHCDGKKLNHSVLDIILRMCLLMTYNIIITKDQFKIVYSFMTQNASLTSETTYKVFRLLEILYIHSTFVNKKIVDNELPKNYIVHNGRGEMVLTNGKELFERNGRLLSVCVNFYIRRTGNDMCELFGKNEEYPSSVFEINMNDGSVLKICLDDKYERMFCVYDASQKRNAEESASDRELFPLKEEIYWYTNLESNSWYSLRLSFKHNKSVATALKCTIITIPNHSYKDTSVYKTNIHTLEIDRISSVKLYRNFYGLSTSIIISDLKGADSEHIDMDPVEKFGIYNNKTFNNFNQANCNKASLKIISFSPHRFSVFDQGAKIVLDDIYSNNHFQCAIVNSQFTAKSDKELFFMFNLPHIYKNKLKNIEELGSVNQLLPIVEVLIRKKCLCNKNFIMFFNLVKIILFKNKMNLLNAITRNFFIPLSVILESTDKKHFSIEVYEIINDIYVYYLDNIEYILDKEKDVEKVLSFPKLIVFNYALIKKFDSTIWRRIVSNIEAELDKFKAKREAFANSKVTNIFIEKLLTIEGIIGILRDFDRFYPSKMCCSKHASFYGKQAIAFKLESSYCLFENILLKVLSIVFPYKNSIFTSLLRLTTMSFSPCLKKFVLRILKQFIQKDSSNVAEFKAFCKRDEIADVFVHLISISDILVQYKLIYLFSLIFNVYPDIVTSDNFYSFVKRSLFLNNRRKCSYASKECGSTPCYSDLESGRKQRSSSFERQDNDERMLQMKDTSSALDIKSKVFYSYKKDIENNMLLKELINVGQLVSPNYTKEYADNKKAYLLQLFEKFRGLFLMNAEHSMKNAKNEVLVKQATFLFNCLCLFVSRCNDLKILTLFGETMKEMKVASKHIYEAFAYSSKDYLYLLFEHYFHLKMLQEQGYKGIGSVFIDNEKGAVSDKTKKSIDSIIKTFLELLKCVFKDSNKLLIFYNFCTFNKLVYKKESALPYEQYITNFFYELFLQLLNDVKPDLKEFSNCDFYIAFVNLLFEFCFVFKHNYELIAAPCDPRCSLEAAPTSKLFALPPFFAHWYHNGPDQKLEWNLPFVLMATFVEMSKSLWNFSETSSLALNDINTQSEKAKQMYLDELVSKYVYPKHKTQYNYFAKLSFLCLTSDGHKSFSGLKVIAFYYLSIFFSAEQRERTQSKREAVKLFIFLFSIIIMCSNINVEPQKKVEVASKINDECLNVLIVVFGSLLQFYFETQNEALKHEFKEWFILTFHLINNILTHRKVRRNSTNPLAKLFKEVLLNDKKKNILLDPGKFNIKLKTYSDMKAVIDNEQFWKPFIESNSEIKRHVDKFYQRDVIVQNCVKHFIIVKNLIPLNVQLYKYHSLDLDSINEFDLKVLTPYIAVNAEPKSMTKSLKYLSQVHCEFEKKFLLEHSQQRRVFNYYQRVKTYKHIKNSVIRALWDLSCYCKSPTYTVEHDELYAKLFHKKYDDSEYFQKFYFECEYVRKEKMYKGGLMVGDDGILFVGRRCAEQQKVKCFFIPLAKVTAIIRVMFKEKFEHKGGLPSLQIVCGEHAKYKFNMNRHDLKSITIMLKMNKQIQSNKEKIQCICYKQ